MFFNQMTLARSPYSLSIVGSAYAPDISLKVAPTFCIYLAMAHPLFDLITRFLKEILPMLFKAGIENING